MRRLIGFSAFILLVSLSFAFKVHDSEDLRKVPKWFSVEFHSLCREQNREGVMTDEMWSRGIHKPYDTVQTITSDSLIISFDFMDDCCLTFSGRAEIKNDTLLLNYGLDRVYTESCGCLCEYRLIYRINKKSKTWRALKIIHKKDEIFRVSEK